MFEQKKIQEPEFEETELEEILRGYKDMAKELSKYFVCMTNSPCEMVLYKLEMVQIFPQYSWEGEEWIISI